ncbi:GAP family protein, partial [Streptomyces sp. NPDC041003]|uniref:GAP family protein n=1 Tax=Streptomyces sp. NPDC041003 TaxID=3155730 RepID=UPI0033E3C4EA
MALDLVVIGMAITLGPLHNSAFILLLSSRRGVRKGLAFLLSWLANLVVVIACVMLLTGGEPPARHTAPSTAAACAKLAIGLGLVLYGAHRRHQPPRPHGPPRWAARVDGASLSRPHRRPRPRERVQHHRPRTPRPRPHRLDD